MDVYDASPVITSVSPTSVSPGAQTLAITGHNFGNSPTINVGNLAPQTPTAGINAFGNVTIYGTFQIPNTPGASLPVTVTSNGEQGRSFFQDPQGGGASQMTSNTYNIGIGNNGPTVSSVNQSATQALYPGAIAAANGVPIVINGNNFGGSPGTVTICPAGQPLPCSSSGVSASITNTTGSPSAAWGNTQIYVLLTASASATLGSYDVWVTASTGANGNPLGAQANAVYGNGTAVVAVNIQLTQVGATMISKDGNYTEDTTVGVTAVAAPGGSVITNFTGTVNIVETSPVPIYSQNNYYVQGVFLGSPTGAGLPSSVMISSGGVTTFLARSLASPKVEGQGGVKPDDAILSTTHSPAVPGDYPPYQGATLSIPQWVDGGAIDLYPEGRAVLTTSPLFDWFQARARDIFATNAPNTDVGEVLASVLNYTLTNTLSSPGNAAETILSSAPQTQIKVNPFTTVLRMSQADPANLFCGNGAANWFKVVILHEARHAYMNTIVNTSVNNASNDADRDLLPANPVTVSPFAITQDTTTFRSVCNVSATPFTLENRGYQGDAPPNGFDYFEARLPPFSFPSLGFAHWALEMDAYTFAGSHQ